MSKPSRYAAAVPLTWGDRIIAVGEPVPEGDEHRDYRGLINRGEIVDLEAVGKSAFRPEELRLLNSKLDGLHEKLDRLLGASPAAPASLPSQEPAPTPEPAAAPAEEPTPELGLASAEQAEQPEEETETGDPAEGSAQPKRRGRPPKERTDG